jgi:hypothetical protein
MKVWIPAAMACLIFLGSPASQAVEVSKEHSAMAGEYESLQDAAAAKRKEAEGLAIAGPCKRDDQCGVLNFESAGQCTGMSHREYSLVSTTAVAAKAAAADYNALALQVRTVMPVSGKALASCEPVGQLWAARCVEKKCVRSEQGFWPSSGEKLDK